ncbi:hypothetical protein IV203_033708 [Nitzschia inconspicua]|uniref:Uncharacterized protein n=1 Tax=Nitzschia inconspicua TaxID=303405 RepID=A0A9K3M3A9_9STRA|nr:hypothetical protein IV203_033708 [Nitzschia inconspicua]
MKLSILVIFALLAASAEARFRGFKNNNKNRPKKNKNKMDSKNDDPIATMEEEDQDVKRYLEQTILSIEGLEPGTVLTDAETMYLEDLILANLNKLDAQDTSNGIVEHHTILFSGVKPDRKLSTLNRDGPVDEYVFNEYTCKYCPNDDDDWVTRPHLTKYPITKPPTMPPTMRPTAAPTSAPTADYSEALREAIVNFCTGTAVAPFLRLRRISGCQFVKA